MKSFEYHEPATVPEACQALKKLGRNARVIAGGTDLVIQMKRGRTAPEHLVNIKNISDLTSITVDEKGLSIGAAVPLATLVHHPEVIKIAPMIAQSAHTVGSAQVRNLATIGGNICNAAPSADMAPGLLALDAVLRITSPEGEREQPLSTFFTGPGTVTLQENEILTTVFIPQPRENTKMVYIKHGPRAAMDCSVTGVALVLGFDDTGTKCEHARLALGAVAPTPALVTGVKSMMEGKAVSELDSAVMAAIGTQAASESSPISDVRSSAGYRLEMVTVLTVKALETLLQDV